MSPLLRERLALLATPANRLLLSECQHGIEKESLRISADGTLAQTPHPPALGSALTHPRITTDYSEALLELITPVSRQIDELFGQLDEIHRFTYSALGEERLWTESMPCRLPATDEEIPIAWYGTSNVGTLKYVYRRGLAVRYGKAMQCIAGIHYNFSLPPQLWQVLQAQEGDTRSAQDYQSERYFALIRNFRRYAWLLMYLFGASPAVCASFLQGRDHRLQPLGEQSLYLPWATSLRMSDLGYNNNAQSGLNVCYNSLDNYISSMLDAISLPYAPYAALGTHDASGQWQQLNTNLLQIENEFYSPIRPKRVANSGEKPVHALRERGVEYIEVRCLDIDPFVPLGIEPATARFLDSFLLYCAISDSPQLSDSECEHAANNFSLAVKRGREPGLMLNDNGRERSLTEWGEALLDEIAGCAALFDQAQGGSVFAEALAIQRAKLRDSSLTPSARVLAAIAEQGDSFFRFALAQSQEHDAYFRNRPLDAEAQARLAAEAAASLADQAAIEAADDVDFDTFVDRYLSQQA
ncbi:glutamate--cysteine ligase [Halopseudomonas aestusnigri]|uniref:Glutamate--cysteine ligase n=1 Tax=Halopseudomonas aestusnigri TaxID=857252 RepID=A0AAQ1JQF8_9GAMM|nr:glutamate--cysteine ligase [Halopseudomonas aestusnigri]OWL88077.1 glutamate--cysteine ligase [Halopseudomonas aestusnigri]SEG45854.1 glutamate-cysteine ligase [Halopseudomonas aestusnigri]